MTKLQKAFLQGSNGIELVFDNGQKLIFDNLQEASKVFNIPLTKNTHFINAFVFAKELQRHPEKYEQKLTREQIPVQKEEKYK